MIRSHVGKYAALAALALAAFAWGGAQGRAEEAARAPEPSPAAAPSDTPEAEAPDASLLEPEAIEAVKRMVETLTGAERLRVRFDSEYDALQEDGETISFGKNGEMTMRRPDDVRIEQVDREGNRREAFFDGRLATLYMPDQNVYAAAERSGDIDSFVDFLRDEVGARLPLAGLFSKDLGPTLKENVTRARYVGEETIDGVECDHVAMRYGDALGVQLWIERERAVPLRIVMTFERAAGRPQFRADVSDWDLSPRVSDSTFAFRPPRGAQAVPFTLPKRTASAGEEGSR
jgi:hypothetical protein